MFHSAEQPKTKAQRIRAQFFHTAKFIFAAIFIMAVLYFSSQDSTVSYIVDFFDNFLTHETSIKHISRYVGRYELVRMELRDKSDGGYVLLGSEPTGPYEVDSRRTLKYEGIKTRLAVAPEYNTLDISPQNICYFQWYVRPLMGNVKADRATVGRMHLQGKQKTFGCLKEDSLIRVPKMLMPLKDSSYRISNVLLILSAEEDGLEQTLFFKKVKSEIPSNSLAHR